MGQRQFEYQVCYGVADRVSFANGIWLGADIPEAQRKPKNWLTCPLNWEFLARAGGNGCELITVIESAAVKSGTVRTYFMKSELE